jgi:hypothetical protein
MRLGRILLASLAPLFSLSLGAADHAQAQVAESGAFIRLLQSVAYLAGPSAEAVPDSAANHPSLHAMLAVTALAATPLGHSLWLVNSFTAAPPLIRSPLSPLLRC